jgi:hypothetical protein
MPRVSSPVQPSLGAPAEEAEAPEATTPVAVPRRRIVWPWIALAVLLAVAALGLAWSLGRLGNQGVPVPDVGAITRDQAETPPISGEEMSEVPDIIELREDEAVETLERAGFRPEALPSQFNDEVRKGTVFEQTPSGEDTAPKGSVVTYVVSLGADPGDRRDKTDDDD